MSQVGAWIQEAALALAKAGIESPLAEARLLAAHGMDRDKVWILAHPDAEVGGRALQLESALRRRLNRYPLAYIVGWREFYGRKFGVEPGVLIPRPETETLVEAALEVGSERSRVLDVGTGSGCLAVTLKAERPEWEVTAVDVSHEALCIAEQNAAANNVEVRFLLSDLYSAVSGERFDLVVMNPPYIAAGTQLMPEVGEWEPHLALFGGPDGMEFYRRLATDTASVLSTGGWLLMEVGDGQAEAASALFSSHRRLWRDLLAIDRVLGVQRLP